MSNKRLLGGYFTPVLEEAWRNDFKNTYLSHFWEYYISLMFNRLPVMQNIQRIIYGKIMIQLMVARVIPFSRPNIRKQEFLKICSDISEITNEYVNHKLSRLKENTLDYSPVFNEILNLPQLNVYQDLIKCNEFTLPDFNDENKNKLNWSNVHGPRLWMFIHFSLTTITSIDISLKFTKFIFIQSLYFIIDCSICRTHFKETFIDMHNTIEPLNKFYIKDLEQIANKIKDLEMYAIKIHTLISQRLKGDIDAINIELDALEYKNLYYQYVKKSLLDKPDR